MIISSALWLILEQTNFDNGETVISPHYLALFTFGMLAANETLVDRNHKKRLISAFSEKAIYILSTVTVLLIMILEHLRIYEAPYPYTDILIGISCMGLLVSLSTGGLKYVTKCLSWKPIAFMGSFAYSIYLIHAPLLQIQYQYIVNPLNLSPLHGVLFYLLVGTPMIIGFAYLFFLVAEKPFIRRR
ncbi:hypothetical protein DC20_13280 [Rufibacter tibetensis]|uniref:Acyltransferase 3 domain-containing protein n=1 Tax=Rufibacter tibetensis TaxID=512763 RepID=A0A0N7HWN8_9BACT|nr:hypothetical protein DC20_13280 [Rufibacter tibetensis]